MHYKLFTISSVLIIYKAYTCSEMSVGSGLIARLSRIGGGPS